MSETRETTSIDKRLARIRRRGLEAADLRRRAEATDPAGFEDRLDLLDRRQDALEALEAEVEAGRRELALLVELLRADRATHS